MKMEFLKPNIAMKPFSELQVGDVYLVGGTVPYMVCKFDYTNETIILGAVSLNSGIMTEPTPDTQCQVVNATLLVEKVCQ